VVISYPSRVFCSAFFLAACVPALSAAPRLSLDQTAFSLSILPGANGATQTANASNLGDGQLSLTATSSVTWLAPTIGKPQVCSLRGECIPVVIAVQSAALAAGVYTGTVTVSDPNAIDAPQSVTVTIAVGGYVPSTLEFFVPPGGSATSGFTTGSPVKASIANSPWLTVALSGEGSSYQVKVTALKGMAAGDSVGSIGISGSSFAPDNKSISVTMHITTLPILQANPNALQFRIAQGAVAQTAPVFLGNGGQGTLTVSSATAAGTGGTWLSAATFTGGVNLTADPTGLAPDTYQGTLTIASNAANSSVVVQVQLVVEGQTAPVTNPGGAVNNGTFGSLEPLSPGDIVAVFGDQYNYTNTHYPPGLPLPTNVGGTQVLVNGVAAPIFFVSDNQIDFEIPVDAALGNGTVQVVRNGHLGNLSYLNVQNRVPRFLLINGGPYAVMKTPDNRSTGIPSHPVNAGDSVVMYMVGLGPTSPSVPSGHASPSSPNLAETTKPQVCFGEQSPFAMPLCVTAEFSGLSPGSAALYQVNAKIPKGLATGSVPMAINLEGIASDTVQIAVQ
jgi:uncharacterized protein (TIGR03437 family)